MIYKSINLMKEIMLTTDAHYGHPDYRTMLSKVPKITVFFWIIKMLAAILAVVVVSLGPSVISYS